MASEEEANRPETEADAGEPTAAAAALAVSTLRPVFLGNLHSGYSTADVSAVFERPVLPDTYEPIGVDRIDLKRGYCFVFLKDVNGAAEKEKAERFVSEINGMNIPRVSDALRAEFARGDGRVKRKEDERRKNIEPSDTLFVVNFHEETTRKADLQMLFEPYGELVRIDMKRNYAFVQFRTIEQATKAKESTSGGKLDQSVLTVEYVARQRMDDRGRGGGGDRDRDRRGGGRRGPPPPPLRGGPPPPYDRYDRGGGGRYNDRDRYDDRYRGGRDRSPPPPYRSSRGRRDSSRSRSPPGRYGSSSSYRDRSPPRRYDDRYDDYRGGGGRGSSPPPDDRYRGRSPPDDRDYNRGGDRDRGYRS